MLSILRRTASSEAEVEETPVEEVENEEVEVEEKEEFVPPVEEALALASFVRSDEDAAKLGEELKALREMKRVLLPVEAHAREQIKTKIDELVMRLEWHKTVTQLQDVKMLDPVVFSWTKRQEWDGKVINVPTFAYLTIKSPSVTIDVRSNGWAEYSVTTPHCVREAQREIWRGISSQHLGNPFEVWGNSRNSGKPSQLRLTYRYYGVIPQEVRAIITAEQKRNRFTSLALVCEVPQWDIKDVLEPVYMDPILVGWRGNALWVLSSFDPTPTEQYILDEFQK